MSVTPTPVTAALAGIFSGLTWPMIWPLVTGTEASATLWLVLATIVLVALPAHAFVLGFQRSATPGARRGRRAAVSHRRVARQGASSRCSSPRFAARRDHESASPPAPQEDGLGPKARVLDARGLGLCPQAWRRPRVGERQGAESGRSHRRRGHQGSWWGHSAGKHIFNVLNAVTASDEVLVCRLIDGKITLVHQRLWPALARLAEAFPPERISQVLDGHTASGRHVRRSLAFADWVPPEVAQEAEALDESEARAILAESLPPGATGRIGRK
jgi:hypothetical protein